MDSLDDLLELGEHTKLVGRFLQHSDVPQELTDTLGIVSWCIVLEKQPCVALPRFASLLMH